MRLKKTDKEAFVNAVMLDVPKIDYEEQLRKAITAKWEAMLPADLLECMRKYPEHFQVDYIGNTRVVGCASPLQRREISDSAYIQELNSKGNEQSIAHRKLRSKLWGIIQGCATLKQAQERLPGFSKYLPADFDGTGVSNLPAVAGVVADFMKAGWPKGEDKQ